ncbi:hypothetical protein BpHYR1_032529 [Brachionus plicatilis]|uniref:Uncharacterized protein n=1 Tax=Brachionus plicatilis TaxID=10195 RepID=A0A3M7RDJ5_BRAPC|nr:hypothetical protein BpHYR1_032529 [Brachionus plicatilis]
MRRSKAIICITKCRFQIIPKNKTKCYKRPPNFQLILSEQHTIKNFRRSVLRVFLSKVCLLDFKDVLQRFLSVLVLYFLTVSKRPSEKFYSHNPTLDSQLMKKDVLTIN